MKLLKNVDIRVVSVLLAFLLWLHAVTERDFTVTFDCPVELVNVPHDLVPAATLMPVSCDITAKGKDILAFHLKTPRVVVDAGSRKARNLSVRLAESHLAMPFGLEAPHAEFQPAELSVRLDRLAFKTVLVVPDLAGQPAEGFIVSDSTAAEPCSARLWGPEKTVTQTDTIFTEPIRIDELRESQRRGARLALPDPRNYRAEPESVVISLVFEKSGERFFRNIPLSLANRGAGFLVGFSPGTVDIVVAGPRMLLERTRPSDIRVFLDLKGLAPGGHRLQAVIELPDRMELIAATPRTFEVTIR